MKLKLLLTCCLFTITTPKAQTFVWAKSFGDNLPDNGYHINLDALGNVYTSGLFYGSVDFNPETGVSYLTSNGSRDIFIQKMDASGNFLWAKSFGGSDNEQANVTVDNFGNVYTTASFNGTIDFDPGTGVTNLTAGVNGSIFIQKLDASGNFVWAKSFVLDAGWSDSICVDTSGNVYTTGTYSLTVDFDPGSGVFNLSAGNGGDVFIQKLDAFGNFVWAKSFGGPGGDLGNLIYVDATGNIFTSGQFSQMADLNPGVGTYNITSTGNIDVFVQKLDASGNFVWGKSFGSAGNDSIASIKQDASGNLYITGQFSGTISFNNGTGTTNLTSNGDEDNYILKLDGSGNFIWAKSFGGDTPDYGISNIDTAGNVFTTGSFYGTVDFDPGTGTANLTSNGYTDIFIQKLNSSGDFIWAKSFGGTNMDEGYALCLNGTQNMYTTGSFSATVDFDPGAGIANLTSNASSFDVFIQKINLDTLGLMEFNNDLQVLAYPNPCDGLLKISCANPISDVEINLTDIQGKLVYSKKLDTVYNTQIEIAGAPSIYFLNIKTASNQSVIKIIKK